MEGVYCFLTLTRYLIFIVFPKLIFSKPWQVYHPILQMVKLRFWEVTWLAQGHLGSKWLRWDLNQTFVCRLLQCACRDRRVEELTCSVVETLLYSSLSPTRTYIWDAFENFWRSSWKNGVNVANTLKGKARKQIRNQEFGFLLLALLPFKESGLQVWEERRGKKRTSRWEKWCSYESVGDCGKTHRFCPHKRDLCRNVCSLSFFSDVRRLFLVHMT